VPILQFAEGRAVMPYVKIEDGIFRNPKVVAVSSGAKLLYVASICYSGSSLTDGFVPSNGVRMIAGDVALASPAKLTKELVHAGLWQEVAGGYQVHDYLVYNESSEKVQAKKDAARERMNKRRSQNEHDSSQDVRANNERSSSEVREPTTTTDTSTTTKPETGVNPPNPPKPAKPEGVVAAGSAPEQPRANDPTPFALLEALCDVLGHDVSVLSPSEKSKQLAVAQRLIAAGMTERDVRTMTRWLKTWMTAGIDMFSLEKSMTKWKLDGKPDATVTPLQARGRASPGKSSALRELEELRRQEEQAV